MVDSLKKVTLIVPILLLGGIVLYNLNPVQYWFMPKCPFKLLTGLNCPGCGIQRALYAMLHGKFAEAISYKWLLWKQIQKEDIILTSTRRITQSGSKLIFGY